MNTGVGTLAPLHCTALGKILLAFATARRPNTLNGYTVRTITDPAALRHHIEQVKSQGYAIDDEEYEPGVRCIAVPVLRLSRPLCAAAIGISGPTSRLPLESIRQVAQTVQDIGQALSARLSFKPAE